jgi:hypothetical protein
MTLEVVIMKRTKKQLIFNQIIFNQKIAAIKNEKNVDSNQAVEIYMLMLKNQMSLDEAYLKTK